MYHQEKLCGIKAKLENPSDSFSCVELIIVGLHNTWKFARSLKPVEFGFGEMRKLNLVVFTFLTFVLINLSDSVVCFQLNKCCCLFFRATISLLRTNSRKLGNVTQFPFVGWSEPEIWVPQWSWGPTSLCFSAAFLQVSTQLQFLCKICVKYGCWPCLHTFYLMFIETRRYCSQAPVLFTNLYWKRSNNTLRFLPHCRDVCRYVLHGTRSFISLGFWSGNRRRESVSVARFHISKYTQHRLGQDKKRRVSPLKMFSEHKWSQWNALLMLFVSECRFQWIFQEIFINSDAEYSSSEILWV